MAQSANDCANLALAKVGHGPPFIADLATDTTKEGKLCNKFMEPCRQALLRGFNWNFAMERDYLRAAPKTITGVANNGGLFQVTSNGHGFANDQWVRIYNVVGMSTINDHWKVTNVAANTFDLANSVFAGAYTSGGEAVRAPAFGYDYALALPAGLMRVAFVNEDEDDYKVEQGFLLIDADEVRLRFVKEITDFTKFDPLFYDTLACYLAHQIAFPITKSEKLKGDAWVLFKESIMRARHADSIEEPAVAQVDEDFLRSRLGVNRFVRDPMT